MKNEAPYITYWRPWHRHLHCRLPNNWTVCAALMRSCIWCLCGCIIRVMVVSYTIDKNYFHLSTSSVQQRLNKNKNGGCHGIDILNGCFHTGSFIMHIWHTSPGGTSIAGVPVDKLSRFRLSSLINAFTFIKILIHLINKILSYCVIEMQHGYLKIPILQLAGWFPQYIAG